MGARKINWLDRFFVAARVLWNGAEVPLRSSLDFAGPGVALADDETNDTTRATFDGGLVGTLTTAAPAAGPADALPATPTAYVETPINGVLRKVAVY